MQKNDYRLTSHSIPYDIKKAKKELRERIGSEHSRATNMYRTIQKHKEYMDTLGTVYNNRCAYCGTPTRVAGKHFFQIDHIIPKSSGALDDTEINEVYNLAYSCSYCNSRKDNFLPPECHRETLSPDKKLGKVFIRGRDYSIKIAFDYIDNSYIQTFYHQIRLDSELRRIDYLLAGVFDLLDYLDNSSTIENQLKLNITKELRAFIGLILPFRNMQRL